LHDKNLLLCPKFKCGLLELNIKGCVVVGITVELDTKLDTKFSVVRLCEVGGIVVDNVEDPKKLDVCVVDEEISVNCTVDKIVDVVNTVNQNSNKL